jgi:hypothetical protein
VNNTDSGILVSEDEVFILIVASVLALVGIGVNSTSGLHRLYFRDNPAPGVVRLGVIGAMLWILFVLLNFADPSVTGVYVLFYLVMGYAVVKVFGQATVSRMGFRTRVDAGERRNVAAATVIAAFTLATGLIFGGSLWGEADAVGDDEGGWWIPLAFFLLGWIVLLIAFGLFRRREKTFALKIHRDRSFASARATASFLVSSGVLLTDAVAGDFWGWRHGLLSFGVLALMLLVHEAFAAFSRPDEPDGPTSTGVDVRRTIESVAYLGMALLAWLASRYVDTALGAG